MHKLATIEGEDITLLSDGSITFRAKAAIDSDGSGPSHGDPCFQNETSLKLDGKSLNADEDRYIVVPPVILKGVTAVVLGSQAWAKNLRNGVETECVVGDIGPRTKLGEMSIACAKALGIPDSPNTGGTPAHIIFYHIQPGVPAVVNGKSYKLQPYRA